MALSAITLRDLIVSEIDSNFGTIPTRFRPSVISFSTALATAIVTHVTTSGEAVIKTSDAGLQRDPATSIDTLGPSADKTIPLA